MGINLRFKKSSGHLPLIMLFILFAVVLTLAGITYVAYNRQQEVRAVEGELNIGAAGTGLLGGFSCSPGAVLHITNVTGQTRCSDVLYVDKDVNSKRVGIGTNDPLAKLHIAGGNVRVNVNYGYEVTGSTGTAVPVMYMGTDNLIRFGDFSGVTATDLGIFTQGLERIRVNSQGRVGIGTTSPSGILHTATSPSIFFDYAATDATGMHLNGRKARGSAGSPTVVTTADDLFLLRAYGYSGASGYKEAARIHMDSVGTVADNRVPGEIKFFTAADAAGSALTQRMIIDEGGLVGINVAAPTARLDISGGGTTGWTTSGWIKAIEIDNASVLKWQNNASGQRHAIGQTTGGLYFARSSADDTSQAVNYDMIINDSGYVTIGAGMSVSYIDDPDNAAYYLDPSQASVLSHLVVGQVSGTNMYVRNTTMTANVAMTFFQTTDASASNEYFSAMQRTNGSWGFVDNEFLFRTDGTANADGSFTGGGADVAEMYYVTSRSEPGDLVAIETNTSVLNRPGQELRVSAGEPYDSTIVGVVSTNPGLVAGYGDADKLEGKTDERKAIALAGRVPLKVSLENGPIKAGDHLSSSSKPGVAMKATRSGKVIGQALEDYDGSEKISSGVMIVEEEWRALSPENKPLNPPQNGTGKIMVYLQPLWYVPGASLKKFEELESKLEKQQEQIDELNRLIKK